MVGEPLEASPYKVRRLGPVMIAVGALLTVTGASILTTGWLALAGLLVVWTAWRAMRLAKQDSESYGGYRLATGTFALAVAASFCLAIYGIARIPEILEERKIQQDAATRAAMSHLLGLLEEYRIKTGSGSYPINLEGLRKIINEPLPLDYWDKSIQYQSHPEPIAASLRPDEPVFQITNFELRSAGPDGVMGTADDIVMRDGVFLSASEVAREDKAGGPIDR